MHVKRGSREVADRDPVQVAAEIPDRMALEDTPGATAIASFVFTRAVQHVWEEINRRLSDPHGALFCIYGPAGTGKTHFLNYVVALNQRAGSLEAESVRNLTIVLDAHGRARDFEQLLLERLVQELAGVHKAVALWRRLADREALLAALDHSRRQGVRSITLALDFGDADVGLAQKTLAMVEGLAVSIKRPKLIVIAAGRSIMPVATANFTVSPATEEELAVAIGRARHLDPTMHQAVDDAYRALRLSEVDSYALYPFHPSAGLVLRALNGTAGVGALARLVRDVLLLWHSTNAFARLVCPSDLMLSATVRAAAELRLGETGRIALRLASDAADTITGSLGGIARQVVDTLMLHELCGEATVLRIEDLNARLPAIDQGVGDAGRVIDAIAKEVASRSRGAILFDPESRQIRFNPRAAGGPELAAFNAVRPLACLFDSTLTPAHGMPELKAKLKRLGDAMANALEGAVRNRDTLEAAMLEAGGRLSADQRECFADFILLTEQGPQALIGYSADADRLKAAIKTVEEYEALALIAALVPRLRAMREFLAETALHADLNDDSGRDQRVTGLETECQLLTVAAKAGLSGGISSKFDALEARFQKFKWTYVQFYRSAHELWRLEMNRLDASVDETNRYLEALRRLNSIAMLGAPEGEGLIARMKVLKIVRCSLDGQLSPEVTPRCPSCPLHTRCAIAAHRDRRFTRRRETNSAR